MIRTEAVWMSVVPVDMRAGTDTLLARIVEVFGEARPHHAYLFANHRGTRMKVVVHDGIGIWLASRRLDQGRFAWPKEGATVSLNSQADFIKFLEGEKIKWAEVAKAGNIQQE